MPTDTPANDRLPSGYSFALRSLAWSLGFFGLVRLSWFETHVVVPLTGLQARIATSTVGPATQPIEVTLACSGADALALCVGVILAYPVSVKMRVMGAASGIALILALNTVRIGTLGRASGSSAWFEVLHIYVWPALLTFAIAGYVFSWMRVADRRRPVSVPAGPAAPPAARPHLRPTARFVWLTVALLITFVVASPLYLQSAAVLAVAGAVARVAASILGVLGVHAVASANMLATERGAFLVTQECISTPLIPVYFAAVLAYVPRWRWRAFALLIAGPLFVALGVARLLVVALPAALAASPSFLIHAFSQLLLGCVVVFLAAFWRHGATVAAWQRAILGTMAGGAVAYAMGPFLARAVWSPMTMGVPLDDPQGAFGMLPAFQVGLYVALAIATFAAIAWRRLAAGLAVLIASQMAIAAAILFVAGHAHVTPVVRDVRAWALAGPILLVAAMVSYAQPRR
ncbi:MAG: hypothetical protein ABI634_18815 [Acidobacteriota bacterium]